MAKFGGMIVKKRRCTKTNGVYNKKLKKKMKEKNLNYYILTMGCQLNENDSEKNLWNDRKYGIF